MEGVFFISFYETMLLQQKQLQQKLTDIQKQLQQLPEGKLICTRCGNRTKWYRSDGHTKTYIPKDQKPYASQLAIRRYLLEKQKEYQRVWLQHMYIVVVLQFIQHKTLLCKLKWMRLWLLMLVHIQESQKLQVEQLHNVQWL